MIFLVVAFIKGLFIVIQVTLCNHITSSFLESSRILSRIKDINI